MANVDEGRRRTRIKATKNLWLSAMIYRSIADPEMDGNITRGNLSFTFVEEPSLVINTIVDALIEVGVVTDNGHGLLSTVPYEDD